MARQNPKLLWVKYHVSASSLFKTGWGKGVGTGRTWHFPFTESEVFPWKFMVAVLPFAGRTKQSVLWSCWVQSVSNHFSWAPDTCVLFPEC